MGSCGITDARKPTGVPRSSRRKIPTAWLLETGVIKLALLGTTPRRVYVIQLLPGSTRNATSVLERRAVLRMLLQQGRNSGGVVIQATGTRFRSRLPCPEGQQLFMPTHFRVRA